MERVRIEQHKVLTEAENQIKIREIEFRTIITDNFGRGDRSSDDNTLPKFDLGLGKFSNNVDDLESIIHGLKL